MKNYMNENIFSLPVKENFLLYAPLEGYATLVNSAALVQIQHALLGKSATVDQEVVPIILALQEHTHQVPRPRSGPFGIPQFLGLVVTRGCNMACAYCDFVGLDNQKANMTTSLVRCAIDEYFNILHAKGERKADIHFFGGEPFFVPEVVEFAVNYARLQGCAHDIDVTFEVITNGLFNQRLVEWIAGSFDSVILSLDGPAEIQNLHRPVMNGKPSFEQVVTNARHLSTSDVELVLRSCITSETVDRMPEIAEWMAQEFCPASVCFESLVPSPRSQESHLLPPDPWRFALNFQLASRILEHHGIQAILSTACLDTCQVSFCPTGHDAMIVTPDGNIHSCYRIEDDWRRAGLNLTFGRLTAVDNHKPGLNIDSSALESIRRLNVIEYETCSGCFCRFHCAGGCHVNRRLSKFQDRTSELCIQTRLVTFSKLLNHLGEYDLGLSMLRDPQTLQEMVLQEDDHIEVV